VRECVCVFGLHMWVNTHSQYLPIGAFVDIVDPM